MGVSRARDNVTEHKSEAKRQRWGRDEVELQYAKSKMQNGGRWALKTEERGER